MDLQFGTLVLSSILLFAVPEDAFSSNTDQCRYASTPVRVDMDRVRDTWLGWYNEHRTEIGLQSYVGNPALDRTAGDWSRNAVERGTIDHKRSHNAAYYDYSAIESWFSDRGVTFSNIRGKTFTENIGWGVYSCSDVDCTDELLVAVRSTYDFFMSEKEKAYRPHYNAIVSDAFTTMGMDIAVDHARKRYYLTAHFGTGVASTGSSECL